MALSDWLLAKLRCPLGGGPLRFDGGVLVAEHSGRRWPLVPEGFPDLLAPAIDPGARAVEEANATFHDGHAADYDRETARPAECYGDVARTLDRLRETVSGPGEVLDAGCGSGIVLGLLRPRFARVAGADVSLGMLGRCARFHGDLVRASAARLPFEDASFDGVTAYSLLHHLREPADGLREFARVLRPGGFLYTDNDSNAAFHERFGWWLAMRRARKAARSRSPEEAAVERLAEFHHGTGLDPEALRLRLLGLGFARVEVELAHPPCPDEFTRLLMELERHVPAPSLRYYFRLIAFRSAGDA